MEYSQQKKNWKKKATSAPAEMLFHFSLFIILSCYYCIHKHPPTHIPRILTAAYMACAEL